jgi:hypothetical protein
LNEEPPHSLENAAAAIKESWNIRHINFHFLKFKCL